MFAGGGDSTVTGSVCCSPVAADSCCGSSFVTGAAVVVLARAALDLRMEMTASRPAPSARQSRTAAAHCHLKAERTFDEDCVGVAWLLLLAVSVCGAPLLS